MRRIHTSIFLDRDEAAEVVRQLSGPVVWGEWLSEFSWDHFVTLTFRYPVSDEAATREVRRWIRRLEQRAQGRIGRFLVFETDAGGDIHVHAHLEGTSKLAEGHVRSTWRSGISEACPYDPNRGASHYVSKRMSSSDLIWEFARRAA